MNSLKKINGFLLYHLSKRKRFISAAYAIVCLLSFPFIFHFYYYLNHKIGDILRWAKWDMIWLIPEARHSFAHVMIVITEHSIFATAAYSIFTHSIERWLGVGLKETPYFNAKYFLFQIRGSYQSVIIQETFIEELIVRQRDEFISALKAFVDNNKQRHPKSDAVFDSGIKVLVLHPFCEATNERFEELRSNIKFNTLPDFQKNLQSLLVELKNISREINKYAGFNIFQLKICYQKPLFSLYYCDNYAAISHYSDKLSVKAPQLVFLPPGHKETLRKLIQPFFLVWENSVRLPETYEAISAEKINEFSRAIALFKEVTVIKDSVEIKKMLIALSDLIMRNDLIPLELVNYLECHHQRRHINYVPNPKVHFNIFGTGGDNDQFKTINISTIASILASHFEIHDKKKNESNIQLSVIKAGTLSVTSEVGSQQFYDLLQSKILNESLFQHVEKPIRLDYNYGTLSMYLPITYFGYVYREIVRAVRKEINNEPDLIDIFKIIFPVANLTRYAGVINGISKSEYLRFYRTIYENKLKTGIILRNELPRKNSGSKKTHGIDELFKGDNYLYYYKDGRCIHEDKLTIEISVENENNYDAFFKEIKENEVSTRSEKDHVDRFFALFNPDTDDVIRETICYNVALFIQLYYLATISFDEHNLHDAKAFLSREKLILHMKSVKEYFFKEIEPIKDLKPD